MNDYNSRKTSRGIHYTDINEEKAGSSLNLAQPWNFVKQPHIYANNASSSVPGMNSRLGYNMSKQEQGPQDQRLQEDEEVPLNNSNAEQKGQRSPVASKLATPKVSPIAIPFTRSKASSNVDDSDDQKNFSSQHNGLQSQLNNSSSFHQILYPSYTPYGLSSPPNWEPPFSFEDADDNKDSRGKGQLRDSENDNKYGDHSADLDSKTFDASSNNDKQQQPDARENFYHSRLYKRSYSTCTPAVSGDEDYFILSPRSKPALMAYSTPQVFGKNSSWLPRNHERRSSVAIKFKHTYVDDYDDPELVRLPSPESPYTEVPRQHVHRPPSPVAERILKGEIDNL